MNDDTTDSQTTSPSSTERGNEARTQDDLHELVGELRAEVTRLKAQKAKARTKTWIQRHPLLALALSAGVGGAAGYGAAMAVRPRLPRSLSGHARQRLRELTGDARAVADRLRKQLSDRAARSGAELRSRAEERGRQLAEEAQQAGDSARREAQEAVGRASEQARKLGEEASERVREATGEATKRLRERRQAASDQARELGEALGKRASEAVTGSDGAEASDEDRRISGTLLALAGIAAGGYVASKVRNWM